MTRSSVFDLIGPIMVGPSSSHTAGAVRIGAMARKICGGEPIKAEITLHGSFAETGKGHGTNLALVGGILGMRTDDEDIPRAFEIAQERGLEYHFYTTDLGDVHPNTAQILLTNDQGESVRIIGSSIGGGRIMIQEINEFEVSIMGDYHTLVVLQRDLPGVVAQVTSIIAATQINIAQMRVSREKKGAQALMVIEMDQEIDAAALQLIRKLPAVRQAMTVQPLE